PVGASIWQWASNDAGDPDVVMACAGDVPTLETMAAVTLLRSYVPDIRIRVVNVVDLMVLQPQSEHPHGPRSSRSIRPVQCHQSTQVQTKGLKGNQQAYPITSHPTFERQRRSLCA